MLLLITYDLKEPNKDYTSLYEAIKKLGSSWWHFLDSTWIINTELSPSQSFDKLKDIIDKNDSIFIVEITGQERQGWLPAKAWDWLKTNDK